MDKTEILNSLTPEQRAEFDKDIEHLVKTVGPEYNFDPTKAAEVITNMRLQNEVFLNVHLVFIVKDGKVVGEILEVKKFKTVDEYLDAINEAKKPKDNFKNINPNR